MDDDWVDVVPVRTVEDTQKSAITKPDSHLPNKSVDKIPEKDLAALYESIQATADATLATGKPVFRVAVPQDLVLIFLSKLPSQFRQEFECSACKTFIRKAGQWVVVDEETGKLTSLVWGDVSPESPFHESIAAMSAALQPVEAGRSVTFNALGSTVGLKTAGGFQHMSLKIPEQKKSRSGPAAFRPAESDTLTDMMDRVVTDYDLATVKRAASLLLGDKLPYAAEHKAAIRWLRDMMMGNSIGRAADDTARRNLLKHHATSAFTGCLKQLRSGALSTLLEDVKAGKEFGDLKRAWNNIVGPLNYMRPSEAPSTGQVAAAEKLFNDLGLSEQDMRQRYCSPSNIPDSAFLYKAPEVRTGGGGGGGGVFGALRTKPKSKSKSASDRNMDNSGTSAISINDTVTLPISDDEDDENTPVWAASTDSGVPPTSISFTRLVTDILPDARSVEYRLSVSEHIYFLVTGIPGTQPLMQWHDATNQASWYTNMAPTRLPSRGLTPGWARVDFLAPFPHLWPALASGGAPVPAPTDPPPRHGGRYLVALRGARESSGSRNLCLFPTLLRADLHGVRRVIEQYSRQGSVEAPESGEYVGGVEVSADGLARGDEEHLFRVVAQDGSVDKYRVVLFA